MIHPPATAKWQRGSEHFKNYKFTQHTTQPNQNQKTNQHKRTMDALSKVIDGYVDQLKATFEGKIDFEGQRKADQLNNLILSLTTVSIS
jgi:hypothetical protein